MTWALPSRRSPILIFTVVRPGGFGDFGAFGALAAAATAAGSRSTAMRDAAVSGRRFTASILLSRQGDGIVHHVKQDAGNDRPGPLIEEREQEAEGDQRRHHRDAGRQVQETEERG